METSDVAALWDIVGHNAGFIVIKPTNVSKQLYRAVKSLTIKSPNITDQKALSNVSEYLLELNVSFTITTLNKQRFVSGLEYFENQRRLFPVNSDSRCNQRNNPNCAVVVHNNWIVGKEAKIYRFREHLMWLYDGDDQYYSSNTRLYLAYINKVPATQKLFNEKHYVRINWEISLLKTAMTIGYLLNRTVILPRFCIQRKGVESPLNSLIHIKTFESQFRGLYRENSFLRHPKVPYDVKKGLIEYQVEFHDADESILPHRKVDIFRSDIIRHFGNVGAKVLTINGLHNVNVLLGNGAEDLAFNKKLRKAFYRSDYMQSKRQLFTM